MSQIHSFRDLIVFQKAYEVSMEIFEIFCQQTQRFSGRSLAGLFQRLQIYQYRILQFTDKQLQRGPKMLISMINSPEKFCQ